MPPQVSLFRAAVTQSLAQQEMTPERPGSLRGPGQQEPDGASAGARLCCQLCARLFPTKGIATTFVDPGGSTRPSALLLSL